jgi:Ca-activated chloride channel family protein
MAAGGGMVDAPLVWRIARADAPADAVPLVERKTREINEALPPGRYAVTVTHGLVTRRVDLDVAEGGPTVTRLAIDAGVLKVVATASRQGDQLAAPVMTVAVRSETDPDAATPLWIGREATAELIVPAGKYAVDVTDGMAHARAAVDVAPGSTITSELILDTGQLELSATGFAGGPPLDRVLYLVAVDDADAPQGRREVARSTAPLAGFTLQAGTYYVTARHGSSEVRERVAISSGDIVKRTLVLDVARLTVKPTLSGAAVPAALPIVTRVFEGEGSRRLVGQSTDPAPVFVLGSGGYRVEAQVGTLNIRTGQTITLAAGKDLSLDLKLEAGEISIAGLAPGQPASAVQAAIRDAKGRVVWRSRQGDSFKTIVAPGSYVLQIDSGPVRIQRSVSLKAGETRIIDIAAP